jgi:hypothetical protein
MKRPRKAGERDKGDREEPFDKRLATSETRRLGGLNNPRDGRPTSPLGNGASRVLPTKKNP